MDPRARAGRCPVSRLGSATLAELVWEVARRLDAIGPPADISEYESSHRWVNPELEALTTYHGTGPLRGYSGHHSASGVPDVCIMPASEAHELISWEQDEPAL